MNEIGFIIVIVAVVVLIAAVIVYGVIMKAHLWDTKKM